MKNSRNVFTLLILSFILSFTTSCDKDETIETVSVFLWTFYDSLDEGYPYDDFKYRNSYKTGSKVYFFRQENLTSPMLEEMNHSVNWLSDSEEYYSFTPRVIETLENENKLLLEDGSTISPALVAKNSDEKPTYSHASLAIDSKGDWSSFVSDNVVYIEPGDYYVVIYCNSTIQHFHSGSLYPTIYTTDGKYTGQPISILEHTKIKTGIPSDDHFKGYYPWLTIE